MTFTTRVLLGLMLLAAPAAGAQEQAPSEAAVTATQAGEGFVDRARRLADETQIIERLNGDVDGWYPRVGGMTTGSGFAFGPGYRMHVAAGRILVDLSAGVTF